MAKSPPLIRPMRLCKQCNRYHTPAPLCSQGFTPTEVFFEWVAILIYLVFFLFLLLPVAVGYAQLYKALRIPEFNDSGTTLLRVSYVCAALTAFVVYKIWRKLRRSN